MAATWSAKNATNAYLRTLKMVGHKAEEPEAAEFISALAAGNNSQLMVIAASATSSSATSPTILALVAAAHQTGGRVICIHASEEETELCKRTVGPELGRSGVLGFVTGSAHELLSGSAQYGGADFVLIDCDLVGHEEVLGVVRKRNGVVVVGYNADFGRVGSWWGSSGWRTQLLPIGDGGLLVTRVAPPARKAAVVGGRSCGGGSRWVVKVDQCTGEEHVFRVR
ncbi:hypothetical protein LINPERHAP2_LOCUS34822 [Linum perenne]